ncbi:PAS domain S-box protein [uncultured Rhodospira sp.]|uniref:PAS domain S-box protein n=1 Tax=uncultured Rhodospira sp. TaxID=1936189 RepID=UPI002636F53B|nr:PAS domain S-box protein [uncultured Rhodospira sp.]
MREGSIGQTADRPGQSPTPQPRPHATRYRLWRRLLPPLAIVLGVLVALLGAVLITARKEALDTESQHAFQDTLGDLADTVAYQADAMDMLSASLVRLPELQRSLRALNRQALYDRFLPLFEDLRTRHGITHFYFHRPDGVAHLRLHQPDRYGDEISRVTLREARRTGDVASGVELGPLGTLTLRVVRPVTEGDVTVGYVELGREIDEALDHAHGVDGVELAVLIDKSLLRREDWEIGMAMLGRDAAWDRYPSHVLIFASDEAVTGAWDPVFRSLTTAGADVAPDGLVQFQGGTTLWQARVVPYRDAAGAVVGAIVMARDVTRAVAAFQSRVVGIVAVTGLVLAGLVLMLSVILRRAETDVVRHEADLAASEERLRATLLSIGDAVISTDAQGRLVQMNPVAEALTAYPQGEAVGRPLDDVFVIQDARSGLRIPSPVSQVLDSGQAVELGNDTLLVGRDGSRFQIADSAAPIRARDGTILGVVLVFRDVTEMYRARQEIQRLNERFHVAADSAGIGVWDMDLSTRVQTWDDRMFPLYGLRPGEGESTYEAWARRVHPDDREQAVADTEAAIARGTRLETSFRVPRPDGSERHLKSFAHVVHDESGQPVRLVGVNYDITERRHLENRLRASERRFRDIVESMSDWVWEVDREGLFTYVSDRVAVSMGHTPQELLGLRPRDFIDADDADRFEDMLRGAARSGEAFKGFDVWARTKAGASVRLLTNGLPVFDDVGVLRGFRGTTTDVTEQRRIEDMLRLRTRALDAATNGILITRADQDQPIVSCNPAFERMTGYTQAEVEGRPCRFLQADGQEAPDLGAMMASLIDADLAGERSFSLLRLLTKHGEAFWCQVGLAPVGDESGRPTHIVAVLEDVSERIAREQDLRDAREQAESANQAKSAFLARMSHELRTPLNAINGFSELMQQKILGPLGHERYEEYVRDIRASGEYLLSLIDDVLDMAKVESGRIVLRESRVTPHEAMSAILTMMRRRAEQRDLTLSVDIDEAAPDLWIDARAFKQMVSNLLSNAIKFTRAGGRVTVGLRQREDGAVALRVEDTGIGIPPEDVATIFEPFRQSRLTQDSPERGTGLGLALVKSLIDLHGGEVTLDSTVGEGTTVTLVFPAHRVLRASG